MKYYGTIQYYNDNLIEYPDTYSLWSDLSNIAKEGLLRRLSKVLDKAFTWVGEKRIPDQWLEFPRDFSAVWIYKEQDDPYFRNHKQIPNVVYNCMIELINNDLNPDNLEVLRRKDISSISDGIINVSFNNPLTVEKYKNIIYEEMFIFTVMGYTQYSRRIGVL